MGSLELWIGSEKREEEEGDVLAERMHRESVADGTPFCFT